MSKCMYSLGDVIGCVADCIASRVFLNWAVKLATRQERRGNKMFVWQNHPMGLGRLQDTEDRVFIVECKP